MLVQFTLKNFLSFKNETTIDMTAIHAYKEHESNLIDIGTKEKFLRVAAIYGANASGKSNLYLAMLYFQRIIANSFNNIDRNGKKAIDEFYFPFSFVKEKKNTEFEIVEIVDGFEYKYGFEYNDTSIVSEWMYRKSLTTNRNIIIFERSIDEIHLGPSIRKECELYKEQIPQDTLALSFFNKLILKTDAFSTVYSAIMDTLIVPTDLYDDSSLLKPVLPKIIDEEKGKLLEFLRAIDTGIVDIGYKKKDDDVFFYTKHVGKDREEYPLALFNESEGTIRSILIYINAKTAILTNKSMFVDELNVKLHPLLLKFIIDLFYDEDSTAQLIYTTHDTTLMDKKFFRRDQIWFVQKDEFGYSELSSLSDFKVRSDASFEKDYLAGVYGGIPLLKDFEIKEDK